MSIHTLTRQQILDIVASGQIVIYKGRAITSLTDADIPVDDAAILADFPEYSPSVPLRPIGTAAGNTNELRFLELTANGVNYTGFKAPDNLVDNVIYTLPSADGSNGQFLRTNGAGVTSWADSGGGLTIGTTAIASGTVGRMLYVASGNVVGEIAGSSVDANGAVQFAATARSSGVAQYFRVNTPADTGITTTAESVGMYFGGNGSGSTVTRTWAAGTVTTQRENVFVAPTYAGASATATFTTAATVAITGAPAVGANAAITNPLSLYVQEGLVNIGTTASTDAVIGGAMARGLNVALSSGASPARFFAGYRSSTDSWVGITDGTITQIWQNDSGNGSNFGTFSNHRLQFLTNNSARITIDNNTNGGVVGINKSSSMGAQLHVVSGSASRVGLRVDSAATPTASIAEFYNNTSQAFTIKKNGFYVTNTDGGNAPEYWVYTLPYGSGFGIGQGNWSGDSISIAMSGNQSPYLKLGSSGVLGWSATQYGTTANVANSDLILRRAAAATLQMGTDAAAPVTQTIKAHDGVGADIAGAVFNIIGGKGTGAGIPGTIGLQFARASTSNSSLNAVSDEWRASYSASNTVTLAASIKTDTTALVSAATVGALWTTQTHSSRTSAITFSTVNNAGSLAEIARFSGTAAVFSKGMVFAYVAKTSTYTAAVTDYVINCTSGTFTINLPPVSGLTGQTFVIKNSGAGTITIDGDGSETIDGATTQAVTAGSSLTVMCTGTAWIVL